MPLPAGVSRRHSNVAAGWLDENVKFADVWFVGPPGPLLIVVSGTVVDWTTTVPVIVGCAEHRNE